MELRAHLIALRAAREFVDCPWTSQCAVEEILSETEKLSREIIDAIKGMPLRHAACLAYDKGDLSCKYPGENSARLYVACGCTTTVHVLPLRARVEGAIATHVLSTRCPCGTKGWLFFNRLSNEHASDKSVPVRGHLSLEDNNPAFVRAPPGEGPLGELCAFVHAGVPPAEGHITVA